MADTDAMSIGVAAHASLPLASLMSMATCSSAPCPTRPARSTRPWLNSRILRLHEVSEDEYGTIVSAGGARGKILALSPAEGDHVMANALMMYLRAVLGVIATYTSVCPRRPPHCRKAAPSAPKASGAPEKKETGAVVAVYKHEKRRVDRACPPRGLLRLATDAAAEDESYGARAKRVEWLLRLPSAPRAGSAVARAPDGHAQMGAVLLLLLLGMLLLLLRRRRAPRRAGPMSMPRSPLEVEDDEERLPMPPLELAMATRALEPPKEAYDYYACVGRKYTPPVIDMVPTDSYYEVRDALTKLPPKKALVQVRSLLGSCVNDAGIAELLVAFDDEKSADVIKEGMVEAIAIIASDPGLNRNARSVLGLPKMPDHIVWGWTTSV
jgi:hypothetical protein